MAASRKLQTNKDTQDALLESMGRQESETRACLTAQCPWCLILGQQMFPRERVALHILSLISPTLKEAVLPKHRIGDGPIIRKVTSQRLRILEYLF